MWLTHGALAADGAAESMPGEVIDAPALEAYLDRVHERCDFHGAVLIVRGEQVLVRKAYGQASDSPPIPATPETVFVRSKTGG